MIIINFIRGFFMALADSVPGVSGGTVAFIMGFYDDFINSLNTLVSKTTSFIEKKKAFIFLFKLGIGWIIGFGLSMAILSSVFDKEIYKVSSLFIGFILFSIPLIIVEEKETLKKNYKYLIFTLLGIIFVSAITFFNPNHSPDATSQYSLWSALFLFISGMIVISAMVLPGISGSTILIILGLYASMVGIFGEIKHLNFHHFPLLIIFGVGILVGVVSIVRVLRYLLTKYRPQMIYLILGLMIGSLYAVFMGPKTIDKPAMSFNTFNILFFIIGALLIFGLDELKRHLK